MTDLLRAESELEGFVQRERGRGDTIQGVLGDGAGHVIVTDPGRAGFFWVRLYGDPNSVVQAWCATSIPPVNDLTVDLQRVRSGGGSLYSIVGRSVFMRYPQDPFFSSGVSGMVGSHAAQHALRDRAGGGFDPVDVFPRALTPLRGRAQTVPDMTVYVEPGNYYANNQYRTWNGGSSPVFDPATSIALNPFNFNRFDLLYLGADGNLAVVKGTEVQFSTPSYAQLPLNTIPICFVYIQSGQTTIQEKDLIDARVILVAATTPVGGNAPAISPYLIWREDANLPNAHLGLSLIAQMEMENDYMMTRHIVQGA